MVVDLKSSSRRLTATFTSERQGSDHIPDRGLSGAEIALLVKSHRHLSYCDELVGFLSLRNGVDS